MLKNIKVLNFLVQNFFISKIGYIFAVSIENIMGRKKKIKETNLLQDIDMPVFVKLEVIDSKDLISPMSFLNIFNNVEIQADRNSVKKTLEYMNISEGMKIQTFYGDEYLIKNVRMIEELDKEKIPTKILIFTLKKLL